MACAVGGLLCGTVWFCAIAELSKAAITANSSALRIWWPPTAGGNCYRGMYLRGQFESRHLAWQKSRALNASSRSTTWFSERPNPNCQMPKYECQKLRAGGCPHKSKKGGHLPPSCKLSARDIREPVRSLPASPWAL